MWGNTHARKRESRLDSSHRRLSRANWRFWISGVPGEYRIRQCHTMVLLPQPPCFSIGGTALARVHAPHLQRR